MGGEENGGILSPKARAWLYEKAARDYGGDIDRTVAALVEAACEAEHSPDLWAGVQSLARSKVR